MGQNFSWLESVGHELEQQGAGRQRAGNLRYAVRKLCVEIECTCFCEPIKGYEPYSPTDYSVNLLRHGSLPREDDGAIEF